VRWLGAAGAAGAWGLSCFGTAGCEDDPGLPIPGFLSTFRDVHMLIKTWQNPYLEKGCKMKMKKNRGVLGSFVEVQEVEMSKVLYHIREIERVLNIHPHLFPSSLRKK